MLEFYKGKKVFITGYTGFKGSWLCKILSMAGAEVTGYALSPDEESLFNILGLSKEINSCIGDIRDYEALKSSFDRANPEIVMHLAAQPIVRTSYENPRYTYETNVMGTVNICECVRLSKSVKSFLNVTTDKVYKNNEWEWGYRENEMLDGYDPYSNSKSCSELVTHSYINSFFNQMDIAVSTARAGNVIGGGDFAKDRLIPDCFRAAREGKSIILRNPDSTRPFQHVLEALSAYLLLVEKQYKDKALSGFYNVGPDERDAVTARKLAEVFASCWGDGLLIECKSDGGPHEAGFLKLDCSKIKSKLGWAPVWNIDMAVKQTAIWSKAYLEGNAVSETEKQIKDYFGDF